MVTIIEFLYLILTNIISEHSLNIFQELFAIPPLNVFALLPLSSYYICIAETYDFYFWLAVIGNGVFFIFIFLTSLGFRYTYYEDFITQQPVANDPFGLAVPAQALWWRRGFFKETHLDYPKIKEGNGAIMEIGFLFNMRFSFWLVFVILLILIFFSPLFSTGTNNFFFFFPLMMIIIIAMMMPNLVQNFKRYTILRTMPLKGIKVAIYQIIPNAFCVILVFYGWICLSMIMGLLDNVEIIIILFWMGGIILFCLIACNEIGYFIFANDDELVNEKELGANALGGLLLALIFIIFTLFIYSIVSIIINSAWKFVIIGLTDLGFVLALIFIFGHDYDIFGKKKKKRALRITTAIVFLIIIRAGTQGYPLFELLLTTNDVPTSWELKVENNMIIEDEIICYEDYIYIVSSGDLTIKNSTIIFDCTGKYSFGIYLSKEGKLKIVNSTISSQNPNYGFKCKLYGSADINYSIFKNLGYRYQNYIYCLGIEIYSNNVKINNSYISDSMGNGITCNWASPQIINTTISKCDDDGIDLFHSSAYMYECTFELNMGDGIYCEKSNPIIKNCTIQDNNGYGIQVEEGKPILENNMFKNNFKGNIKN